MFICLKFWILISKHLIYLCDQIRRIPLKNHMQMRSNQETYFVTRQYQTAQLMQKLIPCWPVHSLHHLLVLETNSHCDDSTLIPLPYLVHRWQGVCKYFNKEIAYDITWFVISAPHFLPSMPKYEIKLTGWFSVVATENVPALEVKDLVQTITKSAFSINKFTTIICVCVKPFPISLQSW